VVFELLVGAGALEVVRVERLIVTTVVEPAAASDWKPADAAKVAADDAPAVGARTVPVLLSVKNAKEVEVGIGKEETELLLAGVVVWTGVDELDLD